MEKMEIQDSIENSKPRKKGALHFFIGDLPQRYDHMFLVLLGV